MADDQTAERAPVQWDAEARFAGKGSVNAGAVAGESLAILALRTALERDGDEVPIPREVAKLLLTILTGERLRLRRWLKARELAAERDEIVRRNGGRLTKSGAAELVARKRYPNADAAEIEKRANTIRRIK